MSGADNQDGNRGWFSSLTSSVMSFGNKVIQTVVSPIKFLTNNIARGSQYIVAAVKAVSMTMSLIWLSKKFTKEELTNVPSDLLELFTKGEFSWEAYLTSALFFTVFFNFLLKYYQMRIRHSHGKHVITTEEQYEEINTGEKEEDPESLEKFDQTLISTSPYAYPKSAGRIFSTFVFGLSDFALTCEATLKWPLPLVIIFGIPGFVSMTVQATRLGFGSVSKNSRVLGTNTVCKWLDWFQGTPVGVASELFATLYRTAASKTNLFYFLNGRNYILDILKWPLVLNPLTLVPKWGNNQPKLKERSGSLKFKLFSFIFTLATVLSYCFEDSNLYVDSAANKADLDSIKIILPAIAAMFLAEVIAYWNKQNSTCKTILARPTRAPIDLINAGYKLATGGIFSRTKSTKALLPVQEHSSDESDYGPSVDLDFNFDEMDDETMRKLTTIIDSPDYGSMDQGSSSQNHRPGRF